MPPWLRELIARADADLAAGSYHTLSVDPDRVRRQLRAAGRAHADPAGPTPQPAALDDTARWLVGQARFTSSTLGGLAGLAGAASVPTEVVAQGIGLVRLAQRLAVVYGFDPATDRGRTALWRALAVGLEIQLPEGPVALRASELPGLLAPGQTPATVGAALARAVVWGSARRVAGRLRRLVPLVASAWAAGDARRRTDEVGERMIAVFRRLAEPGALAPTEDAVELPLRPR